MAKSEASGLRAVPPDQDGTAMFALFATLPLPPAPRRTSLLMRLARRLCRRG